MKQYLSMLLFDRKNLRFSDFVRLQQLEAQLGALEFDGVGDERHARGGRVLEQRRIVDSYS